MSLGTASLTGGVYYVCDVCKEGKFEEIGDGEVQSESVSSYISHHTVHGEFEMIIATIFLSKFLKEGYIDVDRPDLEPLVLSFGKPESDTPHVGLQPSGATGALAIQKTLRRTPLNFPLPETDLNEADMPRVSPHPENGRAGLSERPALVPAHPSLRDMQVTLPWTVKYSRDYRANPQTHKDFAHGLAHVFKAAGKLAGMCDDYDHRRESEIDPKAKDYLADLVICALRMANTAPGGMIDLMTAVQERVTKKNFTEKKVVQEDEAE